MKSVLILIISIILGLIVGVLLGITIPLYLPIFPEDEGLVMLALLPTTGLAGSYIGGMFGVIIGIVIIRKRKKQQLST